MKNYISTPLSTLNEDLNTIQSTLSSKADKSEIPEVPTDLSAFTNSPGYLTAHQSLEDYYTKQEADGKFLTAHQDLTDYATKEFVQSEISDFVTEDALTGLATKEELTAYAQLSDIPEVPEGDYLPLSGGTLSGRIYLKASQSQVVGSNAVLTDSNSSTIYVGSWDESVELTANVTLSVMNAGQDFIDMISNGEEYTGDELTSYTVNAKIQFVGPNGLNKTLNGSGTIGFGYHYVSDNSISFGDSLDADLGHEDESALVFNELVFNMGSQGDNPTFALHFNVDGDPDDFSQVDFGYSDIWTVEEIREETETIDPFVLSSELDGLVKKETSEIQTISTPLFNQQPLSAFELNAAYGTNAEGITISYGTVSLNNMDGRNTILYPARTLSERVGRTMRQVSHNPEIQSYNTADLSTYTLKVPYKDGTIVVDSDLSSYATVDSLSSYATESYVDTKIGEIDSILDSINGEII